MGSAPVASYDRADVDDAALISGTLAGRREDFEVLVERYQRRLHAFATRVLRDADAANDVVQSAFVRAYMNLRHYRGDASFATWLHQIALNECRDLLRARRARRTVPLDEAPEAALATSPALAERGAWRALLVRLVDTLSPRQRTVLTLRIYGDLPFGEIARAEGISENAAKVHYHHAVTRLRKWLRTDS
jgi:RNA polymerase sigma-70 factor (ECF subfamily)